MIEKRGYTIADLPQTEATAEMIIQHLLDDEIRNRMIETIEAEGPIMRPLLYKRVITSFSLKKVGSRIEPVFDEIASSLQYHVTSDAGETVYHNGKDENFFRTAPLSERYSYQIPTEEAAMCINYILENENRIITKSELMILFRNELGYERIGAQVDALFQRASRSESVIRTGNGRFRPQELSAKR